MLTNDKKVWGIWNGGNFLCNPTTLLIETYDDTVVAEAQLASYRNRHPGEYGDGFEVRVISEGHNGFGGAPIEHKDQRPAPTEYN